jgi:hypothetical protein
MLRFRIVTAFLALLSSAGYGVGLAKDQPRDLDPAAGLADLIPARDA